MATYAAAAETPVRICFLGYPGLAPAAKAKLVARHAGLPNDWLSRMGRDYILRYLAACQRLSVTLREECERLDLAFFDTGADFAGALDAAQRALTTAR